MRRVGIIGLAAIWLLAACTPTRLIVSDPTTRLTVDFSDRTGFVRGVAIVPADDRDTALGGLFHAYNDSPTRIRAGWVGGSCPTTANVTLVSVGEALRLTLIRDETCLNADGAFHVIAVELAQSTDATSIQTEDSLQPIPSTP